MRAVQTLLTLQGVEKSFGARHVLGAVSFAVHEGDRIGLVGLNGSGKSTLLRLVAAAAGGEPEGDPNLLPDAGLITKKRGLTVAYVAQEPSLALDRSVDETLREGLRLHAEALRRLEALAEEMSDAVGERLEAALAAQAALHDRLAEGGWDPSHEIRGLAAALSLPPLEARIGALSIGERRRVALAQALIEGPDLLILDEPTNHLDARTIEWLEHRLATSPSALLLVTHDRYFLDRVATRIFELDRARLYAYEGNYTRFLEKQAERLDVEAAQEANRAAFVRRELDWIRRGPKARTTKQQARIDRFEEAVAVAPSAADRRPGRMTLRLPMGGRLGKTILELRAIGKSLGGKKLFSDLTLLVKPGDRIGVVGPNGAGKTTLTRIVLGLLAPDEGEVVVGQNTRFAYLDQGRAELDDRKTVLEEVAGDNDRVTLEDGTIHVRSFLRLLLFDDGFANTPVGTLSGGERSRVQLAKLLRVGGNFLVLDEPTNDLDLVTLGVVEEALSGFPGCALIVSHDRWFLDRVATGILAFEGEGRVAFYEGNYATYLELRPRPAAATPTPASERPKRVAPPAPRRLSYKERQELAGMEAAILAAEERVGALEATLADPAVYKERSAEVPELVRSLEAARAEVERLFERWQELEALPR
jgi:ATP-binding cassette subfamily F protein uup